GVRFCRRWIVPGRDRRLHGSRPFGPRSHGSLAVGLMERFRASSRANVRAASVRLILLLSSGAGIYPSYAAAGPFLFQAPFVSFGAGNTPYSVAIGDLDGDGRPDLVTANVYSNTVSVLLGNGNGTFRGQTQYPTGN